MKFFAPIFVFLFCGAAAANPCLEFKVTPSVYLTAPDYTQRVVQPLVEMDLLHGNVIATLVDNYEIEADVRGADGGWCVALKNVDATIGYSDFTIQIDMRNTVGTCEYNAVLAHEELHVKAYLSVIDDMKTDLKKSIYSAANSVMPVFVRDAADIDSAVNELNEQLHLHPDLVLIKQQIKAAEEIRNKNIDIHENGADLKKCGK